MSSPIQPSTKRLKVASPSTSTTVSSSQGSLPDAEHEFSVAEPQGPAAQPAIEEPHSQDLNKVKDEVNGEIEEEAWEVKGEAWDVKEEAWQDWPEEA